MPNFKKINYINKYIYIRRSKALRQTLNDGRDYYNKQFLQDHNTFIQSKIWGASYQ